MQTNTDGTYIGCSPMVKWAIAQQEYAKRHEQNTTLEATNNHEKEEYGGHISQAKAIKTTLKTHTLKPLSHLQTRALLAVLFVTLARVYYLLAGPRLAEALDSSTVVPLTGSACSAPKPLPISNLLHSQHLSDDQHKNVMNEPRVKTWLSQFVSMNG